MNKDLILALVDSFISWGQKLKTNTKNSFLAQLKPKLLTPNNIRYSIKTAIAVVLSYIFALPIAPEFAFWAPISAIIVMQVSVASSVQSSLDRIMGSLYGAVMGLILYEVLPLDALSHSIGLFVLASLCALLLLVNPRYRLAGITGISIFLIDHQIMSVWAFSISFILLIIVSILVSLLVSVFIWPVSSAEQLHQSLKSQYIMAMEFLEKITDSFVRGQSHLLPSFIDPLHDAISHNRPAFRLAKEYEAINLARHYPELDLLLSGLAQIRVYLSSLLDALDSEAASIQNLPMREELMALSSSAASGLKWIGSHEQNQTLPEVRWYIEATSIRLTDIWKDEAFTSLSQAQLIQVLSFYNAMNHLAETVANLEEQIDIVVRRNNKYTTHSLFKKTLLKFIHALKDCYRAIQKAKNKGKKIIQKQNKRDI